MHHVFQHQPSSFQLFVSQGPSMPLWQQPSLPLPASDSSGCGWRQAALIPILACTHTHDSLERHDPLPPAEKEKPLALLLFGREFLWGLMGVLKADNRLLSLGSFCLPAVLVFFLHLPPACVWLYSVYVSYFTCVSLAVSSCSQRPIYA